MAHIMLIDDQVFYRDYLAYKLQQEGHKISYGIDIDRFHEVVAAIQPDIVILDPFYSELYGYRILKYLKEAYPSLPVVIISAYDSGIVEPEGVPFDGYATKNLDTSEIQSIIHEILLSQLVKEMQLRFLEYSL